MISWMMLCNIAKYADDTTLYSKRDQHNSSKFLLYLCKAVIQPYLEYFIHIRACASNCMVYLLDELHKWVFETVGPTLAAFLTLVLLLKYSQSRCSSELTDWFHFFILVRVLSSILIGFLNIIRKSISTVSFIL